jgi:dTDP-4-dehydrorhamnose reductase
MAAPRILVTGATGFLGPFAAAALRESGCEVRTVARRGGEVAVDLAQRGMVAAVLEAERPDLVLNLAAMSRLADCDRDPARAEQVNAELPGRLAERLQQRLLHVSTDLVFDGRSAPYDETAAVGPLSVYGATKASGEERVLRHGGRVVRLPLLFGRSAEGRGATAMVRAAIAARRPLPLFTNEYRTPLHAADAAAALARFLFEDDGVLLRHLPGPERVSRFELGRLLCGLHALDASLLVPVECQDAARPRDVSLAGDWRARRSLRAMLADA